MILRLYHYDDLLLRYQVRDELGIMWGLGITRRGAWRDAHRMIALVRRSRAEGGPALEEVVVDDP